MHITQAHKLSVSTCRQNNDLRGKTCKKKRKKKINRRNIVARRKRYESEMQYTHNTRMKSTDKPLKKL